MATVRDVARRAGVSPSTASIVLGGKAQQRHISEQTCQKVEQAARELGYTPSLEARSLRGQGGPGPLKVALFWADDRRIVYLTRFLQGAFPELPARNMALEVLPYTPGALSRQEALTGGQRFHAAILANAGEQDLQWLQGQSLPFPLVVYNRAAAGYPCVHSDDRQIGQAAARLLLKRGKRRVAVLTSHPHWKEIALREEQLQKTLGDGGIFVPADWIFREENSIRGGERACRQLLNRLWAQEVRPDSLYCCSDAMAYGALQVLHRQGIRVPQDMAVLAVGNGDPDYRDACLVPLTAVQVPIEEMARQCLLLVEKLLRREEAGDVRVPAPVEERQSL